MRLFHLHAELLQLVLRGRPEPRACGLPRRPTGSPRPSVCKACSASDASLRSNSMLSPAGRRDGRQALDLRGDLPQPGRGLLMLRLQAAHGGALGAMPLFQAGQFRAQRRMVFAQSRRFDLQLLQELPLVFQLLLALLAQFFLFRDRLRLRSRCSCDRSASRFRRSSSSRATESRELTRLVSSASLRISCSSATRSFSRACCTPRKRSNSASGCRSRGPGLPGGRPARRAPSACLAGRPQLARFALHGQRTAGGLLAAGHGVAVIAEAVGGQEVEVRIAGGQALGGRAVLGHEA
jgi:hypothetical protein